MHTYGKKAAATAKQKKSRNQHKISINIQQTDLSQRERSANKPDRCELKNCKANKKKKNRSTSNLHRRPLMNFGVGEEKNESFQTKRKRLHRPDHQHRHIPSWRYIDINIQSIQITIFHIHTFRLGSSRIRCWLTAYIHRTGKLPVCV